MRSQRRREPVARPEHSASRLLRLTYRTPSRGFERVARVAQETLPARSGRASLMAGRTPWCRSGGGQTRHARSGGPCPRSRTVWAAARRHGDGRGRRVRCHGGVTGCIVPQGEPSAWFDRRMQSGDVPAEGGVMAGLEVDAVLRLFAVADHASTPSVIRRQLPALRVEATSASAVRAWERFESVCGPVLDGLEMSVPKARLYRVQTLETFLRHCTTEQWAEQDPETVRRLLHQTASPDALLNAMLLRGGTIFPSRHSWMVAATEELASCPGSDLPRLLEILGNPPFVLCVMTLERLLAAGVEVRPPTGADAALAWQHQWRGEDLPAGPEFVDRDVPGDVVEAVLWRP